MSRRASWWLTVLAWIWPITWLSAKATTLPVVGKAVAFLTLPLFSKKNLNITYIPVNRSVEGHGSSFLPVLIVEELIRQSSHRVIIHRCTCRDAKQCENHPVDLGCLLMGDGSSEIDPRIARHVSVEDAVLHLHKCVENGLIPMTGRVKIDNFIWGVRDRGRLLTVCFCCRCCCTILNSGRYLPEEAAASLIRLKGLSVKVDHDLCIKCGTCVTECFMGAIELNENGISHNYDLCKGCGRCAEICPENAVSIVIDDVDDAVNELTGRISDMIEIK